MEFELLLSKVFQYNEKKVWRAGLIAMSFMSCKFKRSFGPWERDELVLRIDIRRNNEIGVVMEAGDKAAYLKLGCSASTKKSDTR